MTAAASRASCPDENQLARLAEGAIDEAERGTIERHLDGCAACTRLVAELAGLAAPTRSAPSRYKIIRQLGAGAMGVVWEAEDTHLKRNVALKFVTPEGAGDRERRARLFREARALAQLRHPNVVSVHDVGQVGEGPDGELFLAIELVIGTNARAWREAAPRTPEEILRVWKQAAAGIAAVHRAGLVHRDIKPDNVLVADDGRVLVGDFGLATGELVESATALTQSGAVIGTPLYMAPEQLNGEPATKQTDQFALCVSVWEALAGKRPFPGSTIGAIAVAMTRAPELPPRGAGDRRIFAVLARGLLADPAKRWPDIDALLAALERPPSIARRVLVAAGAAGLAAAATTAVLFAIPADDPPASVAEARVAEASEPAASEPAPPPAPAITAPTTTILSSPPDAPAPTPPGVAPVRVARPRTAPPPAPIPVQPPRTVTPPVRAGWALALDEATDQLGAGNGRACLDLLATIPPVPADRLDDAEHLRALCMMAAGDCPGGSAALEALGRKRGSDPARTATVIQSLDAVHCAIDAPPRSRWPIRAESRLLSAVAAKRSCKPVLAFIQQHGLQLPDPRLIARLEAACLVNDGDCDGARAAFTREMIPANADAALVARMTQLADQQFPKSYPRCK